MKNFLADGKKYTHLILAMGLFDTAAWVFYAFALAKNELSITTAITEAYPVLAMFLGLWLNKERITNYQKIGALIAITSGVLLAVSI